MQRNGLPVRLGLALALAASLAACATRPPQLSPGVAWVAAGEQWARAARAVYGEATAFVARIAADRPAGSWAVVLDVDETVLNNVAYQIRRERLGQGYTPESWYAWTQEQAATLVPGAAGFIAAVNAAGGHVALVSNRTDREQLATESNLAALGLRRGEDFRVLLTRATPDGPGDKDARFALLPTLLAVQGYPDTEILAYVGDNVGDQPATDGPWVFFCIDQGAMYGRPCARRGAPVGSRGAGSVRRPAAAASGAIGA